MVKNIGSIDRALRILLALALFSLYFVLPAPWRWLALVGFVPLLTSLVSFCPLYSVFGMNTCKRG